MNLQTIKLSEIVANPNQPRKHFDEQALQELSESIKSDGLMQPITVRKVSRDTIDCYEIVQGERRYRAAKLAGITEIQAFIQELTDEDAFHLAVIENIQREQLTPIEEAEAFAEYVRLGFTHEGIAEKVNKTRTYVTSRMRLLQLEPRIQDWIAEGKLSEGHAKQILRADSIYKRFTKKDYFSYQRKFIDEFWSDLDNGKSVTVRDVKGSGDYWHYIFVNSIILHLKGVGDTIVNDSRGMPLTAEMACSIFNLHVSDVTEEDINFMLSYDLESMKEDFNDKLRPWMIEKFWDDMKLELFKEGTTISSGWKEPLNDCSLEEHTVKIKEGLEKIDATLFLFAEMFHSFADKNGKERMTNEVLAERALFNEIVPSELYTVEELAEKFKVVQEREFSDALLNRLRNDIEKDVSRDTIE